MIEALNDPYSKFFIPSDAANYINSLNGESFTGIGIYLDIENNEIVIISTIKNSPAEKAGLKLNDKIIEIDGIPVKDKTGEEVIDMIRGPEGSKIKLKINRNGKILIKNILREKIDIPYVEGEIQNGIGIIYYYQFTANSNSQFKEEINKILEKNPKGLILDLRNNPGGYLSSAKKLISHFVEAGKPYAKLEFGNGSYTYEKSLGPGELKEYPLIILINEGTASASEIVALALAELNGAKLIGTQSYGKGKTQEIITYTDGSSLKLSTAKWMSINGTYIDQIGIMPDITVELTENDYLKSNDPQLEEALKLLSS
jgi:carboxyl-terminal processing protease